MATVKKTLSIDESTWGLAEQAAELAGMSPSAWLSRTARQQAIREGYSGGPTTSEAETSAIADETEAAIAGDEPRAAG